MVSQPATRSQSSAAPSGRTPSVYYQFSDNVRFISILAIVMLHAEMFYRTYPIGGVSWMLQAAVIQLPKFGTICFFLISGFLLGDKLATYSVSDYFKRRFQTTIKPYLFWVCLSLLISAVRPWTGRLVELHSASEFGLYMLDELFFVLFLSNYWFILTFLISLFILLVFRRYLMSYRFGLILFGLTLFYSTNLYFRWILTDHTAAFLGFVFYLWLGVQFNRHQQRLMTLLNTLGMRHG
jgi:hypothetical protein